MTTREQMTRSTFNAIHPSFRHIMQDGTPVVMRNNPKTGGCMLVPVEITEGTPRYGLFSESHPTPLVAFQDQIIAQRAADRRNASGDYNGMIVVRRVD